MSARPSHCSGDMYSAVPMPAPPRVLSPARARGSIGAVEPEVDQRDAPVTLAYEDVLGLQVPVDVPLVVDGAERRERRAREAHGLVEGQRAGAIEQLLGQRAARQVLHHHVGRPVAERAAPEHPGHVGRPHLAQHPHLVQQAEPRVGPVRARELDGHGLAAALGLGREDGAEPAAGDDPLDAVPGEMGVRRPGDLRGVRLRDLDLAVGRADRRDTPAADGAAHRRDDLSAGERRVTADGGGRHPGLTPAGRRIEDTTHRNARSRKARPAWRLRRIPPWLCSGRRSPPSLRAGLAHAPMPPSPPPAVRRRALTDRRPKATP